MMEAQTVWTVWRRILREPPLLEAIFTEPAETLAERFGLSDGEVAAATVYAQTPKGTRWFVTTYRFRMVNSYLHALETGAPLTLRALMGAGVEWKQLAGDFFARRGWHDYGAFVYTFCAAILDDLAALSATGNPPGLLDLIAVERASVELVRRHAQPPAPPEASTGQWRRTGRGTVVAAAYRLSSWLRDTSQLGRAPLEPAPQSLLVYLPSLLQTPRLAALPDRAAALYAALDTPCDGETLGQRLAVGGLPATEEGDGSLLARLAGFGVIERVGQASA